MRRHVITITLTMVAAVAATGCGGGDDPPADPGPTPAATTPAPGPTSSPPAGPTPDPTAPVEFTGLPWEGQIEVDRDTGEFTAPGFNELVDTESPDWSTTPESAVSMLLHLDRWDGEVDVDVTVTGDAAEPTLTVTLSQLGDDSVAQMRYEVTLTRGQDDGYRFVSGRQTHRCQPDRGPQEFGTEPCV